MLEGLSLHVLVNGDILHHLKHGHYTIFIQAYDISALLTQSHTFIRGTQVYQEINYVMWLAIIIEQAPVIEIEN